MNIRPATARHKIAVVLLIAVILCTSGCAGKHAGTPEPAGGEVPAAYQQLYKQLKADMDSYNASLDLRSPAYPRPIYGAELLPANGNRGEDLLKPANRAGTVAYLDQLQGMGVRGVTIAMPYPMYMPESPRHGEYVSYFKYVFAEIRKRGMVAEVETGIIFAGTAFSTSGADFGETTFERYKADKKRMVRAIIDDLHPDYLDLGAEPDTEYKLTGWGEFNSPVMYAGYVSDVLDGLNKGQTKVGAGIGSWGNVAYVEEYVKIEGLDFVAVHVYPVEVAFLEKIDAIAALAHGGNKSVVMDECWLYKTKDYSHGMASSEEAFKRDAYSFWAPLDQQFLALMDRSAKANGVEYISPFWANFFFAYLDYSPSQERLSYREQVARANREASRAITAGEHSPTGEYYNRLIAGNL